MNRYDLSKTRKSSKISKSDKRDKRDKRLLLLIENYANEHRFCSEIVDLLRMIQNDPDMNSSFNWDVLFTGGEVVEREISEKFPHLL